MTEAEWLACRWPGQMLKYLTSKPGVVYKTRVQQHPRGRRKLRLFGVAVARRVIHLVSNPHLHELLVAAEAFADGVGTQAGLERLRVLGGVDSFLVVGDNKSAERYRYLLTRTTPEELAAQAVGGLGARDARSAASGHNSAALALERENIEAETARQCDLLRDIFGSPFHKPPEFNKAWRTDTAVSLARQMYDSRDFSALPILADALQDAGCDSADVLSHCRGPGPHVRGCWVVDLVLGKE
jgi:hypothetical protein